MQSETKNCQNCKKDFIIEPDDFSFYEKIKVPPPTFCPECRCVRRMTWRNERSLYKRRCDKTGKEIISMFHPLSKFKVYDHDVWWSDQWEPCDYGMDYDFNKPFFQQFRDLLEKVPLANLGNQNSPGSIYGNHNADCKFSYLLYASFNNERVHYSYGAVDSKDCFETYKCFRSELSYGNTICAGLYSTHFSYNSDESINSFFLKHCKNLQDCIGCINLNHKTYCIFNVQYTKEEYEKKKKEFDFGSYKNLKKFEQDFEKFTLDFPNRYANVLKSTNVTGDNILNSKNAQYSFDLYDGVEDSKYLIHIWNMKDSYDSYGAGAVASLMYEGVDAGIQSYHQLFSVVCHTCVDTNYTYMCYGSKDIFGCIGLRNKQYCILNKQYTKEEYEVLLPKIIEQMKTLSYKDKKGCLYYYGEFFPSEISPFAYNETIAQEYFTKSQQEIVNSGLTYRVPSEKDYKTTLESRDLPDHIKDIDESILDEIITCPNNGSEITQCTKAYRIIKTELDFLKNNNIALPRYCPNCRHYQRLAKRNPFKLWSRQCMCDKKHNNHEGKCEVEFETSYAPERPEIIYCEKCYQQEVY